MVMINGALGLIVEESKVLFGLGGGSRYPELAITRIG